MDYGHTGQQNLENRDFFTAGAGLQDEEVNNFEAENNLDLSNPETSWQDSSEIESKVDFKKVGKNAIDDQLVEKREEFIPEESVELGQVQDMGLPPEYMAKESTTNYDKGGIRTTGDRLSDDAVKIVDKSIRDFENNQISPADFYREARAMTGDNLDNSYNRKIGAA